MFLLPRLIFSFGILPGLKGCDGLITSARDTGPLPQHETKPDMRRADPGERIAVRHVKVLTFKSGKLGMRIGGQEVTAVYTLSSSPPE